jgi:hypothetical protein
MKTRIIKLIFTFVAFVLLFALQKPLFMLFYHSLFTEASGADWLSVIRHGLPLDLSIAGYMSVLPGLLAALSVWIPKRGASFLFKGYFAIIALLMSVIFVLNLALYSYWGFPLDTTPFFYFFTSPADAVASVSWWMVIGGIVAMLLCAAAIFWLFCQIHRIGDDVVARGKRTSTTIVLIVLTALLFIPIRGGCTNFRISEKAKALTPTRFIC